MLRIPGSKSKLEHSDKAQYDFQVKSVMRWMHSDCADVGFFLPRSVVQGDVPVTDAEEFCTRS